MSDEKKINVLGIDIGGTKIAVCLANSDGEILGSGRISSTSTYEEILKALAEKCRALCAENGLDLKDVSSCGICAPGPLDLDNGMLLRTPNVTWIDRPMPIRDDLAALLGIPAALENDANAGVLAEWFYGSGKGKRNMIYLTMSTGIGGGIVSEGKLVHGFNGNAGELGHMVLDIHGPLCNCGLRGCLEAYCGGRAVAKRVQEIVRHEPTSELLRLPGVDGKVENLTFQSVRDGAKAKIPLAMEMWDEICLRLAQGIGNCMSAFNPELVVLGTAAYYAGDFLMKPVLEYLPRFTWPVFYKDCEVRLSALGLKVGELAGASVALNVLYERGEWRP